MSCNCSPTDPCTNCCQGQPCGCPPDYSTMAQPVDCLCCPPGYYELPDGTCCPNGTVCDNSRGTTVPKVACQPCVDSVPSDCVFLPAIPCWGVTAGTTLTSFISTVMCSSGFIAILLERIGLDVNLGSAFCQLVQNCPSAGGGTTPVLGAIIVTVP